MKKVEFKTQGTCSSSIEVTTDNGIIEDVHFQGGCNGNLKGICSLVKGMPVEEVIHRLEGIHCGARSTSCPDQLAKALKETL